MRQSRLFEEDVKDKLFTEKTRGAVDIVIKQAELMSSNIVL